jgi:type IV pilus assembly protein PilM
MISLRRAEPHPIGLVLSRSSATLVQLAGRPGHLEVHALATGPLPVDEQAPLDEQDRAAAEALRRLVGDHRFRGRQVVSCLGPQELFVQNVRIPQLPEDEVAKVVQWEAEERLPYPAAEAEVRHLLAGQVRQESGTKQEVLLLASHRGTIERHVRLLERAGLVPAHVDAEPCAMLRCLLARSTDGGGERRRAYVLLGDRATTVVFAEGPRILFLKFVSTGGVHFDQAVARHMEVGNEEAARIRATVTAAAALDPDDEIHHGVADAIRGPLEAMGGEIELCLRYYAVTFRGKPLERVVLCGDEASPWLADYFGERLRLPCDLANPFDVLARWPLSTSVLDRPWRWTTAMGLSLRN